MKTEILFAKYKDTPVRTRKKFESALKEFANEVNLGDLWTRIQNYQIDKYGEPISLAVSIPTFREKQRLSLNAVKRRYYRRGYKGYTRVDERVKTEQEI